MSIVIIAPTRDGQIWKNELLELDNSLDIEIYPNVKNPENVNCAILWLHPYGCLKQFSNLKLICSMGAGVDHILNDPELPEIPVTRIVSDTISTSMSNYVIMAVLQHHRMMEKFEADQKNKVWDQATFPEREVKIGILGLGVLGSDVATKLVHLGFEVHGLSKSRKSIEGVISHIEDDPGGFFKEVNVLVCLLPMTEETRGYLSHSLFNKLEKPCYLISVGRGFQQKEVDIIEALDNGKLNGAFIDVFEVEPLPESSPLWDHPKVKLTPHNASITNPKAAVPIIYDNYRRMMEGRDVIHEVSKSKGY